MTIIEFMIVLVVIGLLLSGILKGQELINNARIKKLTYSVSSLYNAVQIFNDRFQALPGDFRQASGYLNAANAIGSPDPLLAFNGNGDGMINLNSVDSSGARTVNSEASLAMHHLSAASMFVCANCIGLNNSAIDRNHLPTNVYGGHMAIYSTDAFLDLGLPLSRNIVHTGRHLPPDMAFVLDQKLDDGHPGTGVFRATTSLPVGASTDGSCTDASVIDGREVVSWNLDAGTTDCAGAMIF